MYLAGREKMIGSQCRAQCSAHCTNSSECFVDWGSRVSAIYIIIIIIIIVLKVFMSAFRNLNAPTCYNKIKYNDDTNSQL